MLWHCTAAIALHHQISIGRMRGIQIQGTVATVPKFRGSKSGCGMLLHHRNLPHLLLLPSTHSSSSTLLRPSRFPQRLSLSPRTSALSHLATPQPIDHSDSEEVQLPLDRLFLPPGASVDAGDEESVSARVLKDSNIVLGPYARGDAQVVNADFVKSSVHPEDCPKDGLPEFALVGRSNVGKSSLLNSLVRRKRLALTCYV